MKERVFLITMKTPIGLRKGKFSFQEESGVIFGLLEILGHANVFEGSKDENGKITIQSEFQSFKKSVRYDAEGTIQDNMLALYLNDGKHTYKIEGTEMQDG